MSAGKVALTLIAALAVLRLVPVLERLVIRWASKGEVGDATPRSDEDARQRVETLTRVTGSVARAVIWTATIISIMGTVGIAIGPLLAGAGIAGVAIGFGAQSIVKDFFSGFFILLENQYDVGDVITVGAVTGTVERMTMRITVIRDGNGTAHFIPNSNITNVANRSFGWGRGVLDVVFAPEVPESVARGLLEAVAQRAHAMAGMNAVMLEAPSFEGPTEYTPTGITWRLTSRTAPGRGSEAKRALISALHEESRAKGFVTTGGALVLRARELSASASAA